MTLAIISFLLIVQGTGPSTSVPQRLGEPYNTEAACKEDGETLSKVFRMKYFCLAVRSDR